MSPLDRALRFLSYRPRTEKEIRDKLGVDCSEEIISKLKSYGYINDEKYAEDYIESRIRSKPRSQKLILLELKRKGIVMPMNDYRMPMNDSQLAKKALEKKKNLKTREQAMRFLASRGFTWDVIEKTVKKEYN